MPKDTFWFTHDYNARNDDKILELRSEFGAEGYGIFWMIIETMADSENGGAKVSLIGGLSHGYGIPKATLTGILKFSVDIGLLYEEDGFYFSKRILKHKVERRLFKEKGREGGKKRWNKDKPAYSPPSSTLILKTEHDNTLESNNTNGTTVFKEHDNYTTKIWRKDCATFLKDTAWKEQFCMHNKIDLEDLEKSMKEFVSRLNLQEDFKNVGGLKKHYIHHYNKHGLVISEYEESKKNNKPQLKLP